MRVFVGLVLVVIWAFPSWADEAGDFDYYVMSLSWSPNWCDRTGHARGSEQCEEDRDLGWILHGLWPQYEEGWPAWCHTDFDEPSWAELEAVEDLFGTASLARHQWEKHGSCSGLDVHDYLTESITAYSASNARASSAHGPTPAMFLPKRLRKPFFWPTPS